MKTVAVHPVVERAVAEPLPPADRRKQERGVAHALGAPGEDHPGVSQPNGSGGVQNRPESRGARLVHGPGRHPVRETGPPPDLTGGIRTDPGLPGVSEDDLVHRLGGDAGGFESAAGRGRSQLRRAQRSEGASEPADRGAPGSGEDDLHWHTAFRNAGRIRSRSACRPPRSSAERSSTPSSPARTPEP